MKTNSDVIIFEIVAFHHLCYHHIDLGCTPVHLSPGPANLRPLPDQGGTHTGSDENQDESSGRSQPPYPVGPGSGSAERL